MLRATYMFHATLDTLFHTLHKYRCTVDHTLHTRKDLYLLIDSVQLATHARFWLWLRRPFLINSGRTPEEADWAKVALSADAAAIAMVIAEKAHFIISSFVEKIEDTSLYFQSYNCQKRTLIKSSQNILDALLNLCQDKQYEYISDIISTNTKPTQASFFSTHPVRTQPSSTHHVNPGSINPIIGLDVPSGTSPIDTEIVENLPIFNPNLQEQPWLIYN